MIRIIILIFINTFFINTCLYSFIKIQNDEKFELISDFGKLNKDKSLNLGIKIKAFDSAVSIFSDNYKVLFLRNKDKSDKSDKSILIILDLDLNLKLDIFGDFVYENKKIKFLSSNFILDLVVRDDYLKRLINPIFILKSNDNLLSSIDFDLENITLFSKKNEPFNVVKDKVLVLDSYNYSAFFSIKSLNRSTDLKGIYYIEIFLNNKSIFRKEFQNIYLDKNEYKLSGDIYNSSLENLELKNLKFNKGINQIKVEYGDLYSNERIKIFRVSVNE